MGQIYSWIFFLKISLVHFLVGTDIYKDNFLFSDDKLQGDAITNIDGNSVQSGKLALERM